jgi:hypothetical protein
MSFSCFFLCEILQSVQWRVWKECVNQALSFISELSEEIQIVSLHTILLVEAHSRTNCAWVGKGNKFLQNHRGVEEFSVAKSSQSRRPK